MISNIILTTNNLTKAELFYDGLFALFGAIKTKQSNLVSWRSQKGSICFMLQEQQTRLTKTLINTVTISLTANSKQEVALIYNVAIRLGATCAGKPSQQKLGIHCAYFLDNDANRIAIIHNN